MSGSMGVSMNRVLTIEALKSLRQYFRAHQANPESYKNPIVPPQLYSPTNYVAHYLYRPQTI